LNTIHNLPTACKARSKQNKKEGGGRLKKTTFEHG